MKLPQGEPHSRMPAQGNEPPPSLVETLSSADAGLRSIVQRMTNDGMGMLELAKVDMVAGFVECAHCKKGFPKTDKLEGRRDVRVLPCFHSVCGPCLQDALANSPSDLSTLECPICARSFQKKALHDFLPNFSVLSSIDHENIGDRDFMCEECVLGHKAELFCKHCVMNLCGSCARQHQRSKATVRHKLVNLMEQDERIAPEHVHRAQFCAAHRQWRYEYFCEDCDTLICYQCAITDHQTHAYKLPSDQLVGRHRKIIESVLEKLGSRLHQAQATQKRISEVQASTEQSVATVRSEINKTFDELLSTAETRCSTLTKRLNDGCRDFRASLERQKTECTTALVDIWRTIDFLEKAVNRGTDVEVLKIRQHISQEKGQLKQLHHWRSLVQREMLKTWHPGDIQAGWQSVQEAEMVATQVATTGNLEVLNTSYLSSAKWAFDHPELNADHSVTIETGYAPTSGTYTVLGEHNGRFSYAGPNGALMRYEVQHNGESASHGPSGDSSNWAAETWTHSNCWTIFQGGHHRYALPTSEPIDRLSGMDGWQMREEATAPSNIEFVKVSEITSFTPLGFGVPAKIPVPEGFAGESTKPPNDAVRADPSEPILVLPMQS